MAEGFARAYGSDVLEPSSAGLAPAAIVQNLTKKVMEAKNINIDYITPRDVSKVDLTGISLIVNMTGRKLPTPPELEVRDWKIEDPIGKSEEVYVAVRDQIEMQVMYLILELRRKAEEAAGDGARAKMRPRARQKQG
jgi:protein-tyrosine-phosphatase